MTLAQINRAIQKIVGAEQDGDWGIESATKTLAKLGGIAPAGNLRQINAKGLALVKHFEGCSLKAYQDEVGVWTIGYGHTGLKHNDGTVCNGRTIDLEEAEQLLLYDMDNFDADVVATVEVPMTDDQFSALVSFDFNTGSLGTSTLLRKLNGGDYSGAADELLRWNRAGGKVLRGLTLRRQAERSLFLGQMGEPMKETQKAAKPEGEAITAHPSASEKWRTLPALDEQEQAEARQKPDSPD